VQPLKSLRQKRDRKAYYDAKLQMAKEKHGAKNDDSHSQGAYSEDES